jgi:hypothetical protein
MDCVLFLSAQDNKDEVIYKGIRYNYTTTLIDSNKYEVVITRTNTSSHNIIVMNTYNNEDFDTTGNYKRCLDQKCMWRRHGLDGSDTTIDFPHYRGYFEQDTLIDYFTEEDNMNKAGTTIHIDGPYYFTKILQPLSSNQVKFKIRTNDPQFYFYEKFWDAGRSDLDDWSIKNELENRKKTIVCFPIKVKRGNN